MLKCLVSYVAGIAIYYIQHIKLLAMITIFAYGFSSSAYAGYWIDYTSSTQTWPSSNYAQFMQGATTVSFSAEVLGGGLQTFLIKEQHIQVTLDMVLE